jgi:bifunctional DNA-binding transcriptional regulator/antitoxin component of YhaV-PrlF toxin-antitoxin module
MSPLPQSTPTRPPTSDDGAGPLPPAVDDHGGTGRSDRWSEQVIVPLIPSPARLGPAERRAGETRTHRSLPLAAVPEPPPTPSGVVYGMGRVDESGRIGDRTITDALGWRPGDRLTVTATTDVVLLRRDPAGVVAVSAKAHLTLPAVPRRHCGMRPGDRVLLVATPEQDTVAVYPLATLHRAILHHHSLADGKCDPQ